MFKPLDIHGEIEHVYVGPKAGQPIESAIDNAGKSVTVASPYISAKQYRRLLRKQREGVDVALLFHELSGLGTTIQPHEFLEQLVTRDDRRHRWRLIGFFLSLALLMLSVGVVAVLSYQWPEVLVEMVTLSHAAGFGAWSLVLVLFLRYFGLKFRTHSYRYQPRLSHLCWLGKYRGNTAGDTIHAKCYVIDDRKAFVGSMNFTAGGMTRNVENRVDIDDPPAARKLGQRIRDYIHSPQIRTSLQHYGRTVYSEPPNGPNSISRLFQG